MDKFVARENIKHFRDRLCSEIDAPARSRLQNLLVEEEDKLIALLAVQDNRQAARLELLAEVERVITNGAALIENQKKLVALLDGNGQDNGRDRALLEALAHSQALHQQYHQKILIAFKQTRS
jgi:hypothetical protein